MPQKEERIPEDLVFVCSLNNTTPSGNNITFTFFLTFSVTKVTLESRISVYYQNSAASQNKAYLPLCLSIYLLNKA